MSSPPAAERVVQELVDEHLHAWCGLIPIDEHTGRALLERPRILDGCCAHYPE
jgi:hypothetical protein